MPVYQTPNPRLDPKIVLLFQKPANAASRGTRIDADWMFSLALGEGWTRSSVSPSCDVGQGRAFSTSTVAL